MNNDKLEKIKTQYEEMSVEDISDNYDDAYAYLCVMMDDLDFYKSNILNEMKYDCKQKKISEIKNYFSFITGMYYDAELYDLDLELLDNHLDLILDFGDYSGQLLKSLEKDNVRDIFKLTKFVGEKYLSNYHYLEDRRDSIDCSSIGINFYSNRYVNDREEFKEFFNGEIKRISSSKAVEKVKKM